MRTLVAYLRTEQTLLGASTHIRGSAEYSHVAPADEARRSSI